MFILNIIYQQIFNGNFDRNTTVKQILCDGFLAQRLRIIVQDKYGGGCMRAEIYGVQRRQGNVFPFILMVVEIMEQFSH